MLHHTKRSLAAVITLIVIWGFASSAAVAHAASMDVSRQKQPTTLHPTPVKPLDVQDPCLDIIYNQHTYHAGDTLPPFPVGINFAVNVDWGGCFIRNVDTFSVVADVYSSSGAQLGQQQYDCNVPFTCDGDHTFGYTVNQVGTSFAVALDEGPGVTYSATVNVDPGACNHPFVEGDASSLTYTIGGSGGYGTVQATVWEYFHWNPNSSYTACDQYYAKATYDATHGLAGKGAIWLYNYANGGYLASTPTPYTTSGHTSVSGYTNTVYAPNGVEAKLGIAPNSSSTYTVSPYLYGVFGS